MKRIARSLVVITAAIALGAPGLTAGAAPRSEVSVAQAVGSPTVWRVKILDRDRNLFRPRTITIARGDSVKWKNRGNLTHTSTSAAWDSGSIRPGDSFKRRFRRAGTFDYHCSIHPEMTGTITVR